MEITSALQRSVSAQLAATELSASDREKNATKRIIWIKHLMYSVSSMIFRNLITWSFLLTGIPPVEFPLGMHSIPN